MHSYSVMFATVKSYCETERDDNDQRETGGGAWVGGFDRIMVASYTF